MEPVIPWAEILGRKVNAMTNNRLARTIALRVLEVLRRQA
jgi:hypothetical protein